MFLGIVEGVKSSQSTQEDSVDVTCADGKKFDLRVVRFYNIRYRDILPACSTFDPFFLRCPKALPYGH
jgi:hypothetical protein